MSQDSQSTEDGEPDLENLISNFANIFIVANNNKIPIKRSDMIKSLPKESVRKFNVIVKRASKLLEQTFGYKIVDLQGKNSYVLMNQIETNPLIEKEILKVAPTAQEASVSILRTNLLISIFMGGGVVPEGTIKEFLKKFGVDLEFKRKHHIFGDVQKLIMTDFVRQGYLEIKERKDLDNAPKEYCWGNRAELEVDKNKLLEFVAKVYGEHCKPEMFTEQWKQLKNNKEKGN